MFLGYLGLFMALLGGQEAREDVLELDLPLGLTGQQGQSGPVTLAGKLITEKNYNVFALIDVMVKAFRPKGRLTARDWGKGLIIFSFESVQDREWVLKNQPWHFDGFPFVVKGLTGLEQPSAVALSKACLWVRVFDLPLACRSEAVFQLIGGRIGMLECYEKPSILDPTEYFRLKVEINITKPLLRGLNIKIGGDVLWLPFSYESLPNYCFNCGKLGHFYKSCASRDRDDNTAIANMLFGPSLRASIGRK